MKRNSLNNSTATVNPPTPSTRKTRLKMQRNTRIDIGAANTDGTVSANMRYMWLGPRGRTVFPGVDYRTGYGRAIAGVYEDVIADLGGEDNLSRIERELVKDFAVLRAMADEMTYLRQYDLWQGKLNSDRIDAGEDKETVLKDWAPCYDYLEHLAAMKTSSQIAKQLGLEKRAKPINEGPATLEAALDEKVRRQGRRTR